MAATFTVDAYPARDASAARSARSATRRRRCRTSSPTTRSSTSTTRDLKLQPGHDGERDLRVRREGATSLRVPNAALRFQPPPDDRRARARRRRGGARVRRAGRAHRTVGWTAPVAALRGARRWCASDQRGRHARDGQACPSWSSSSRRHRRQSSPRSSTATQEGDAVVTDLADPRRRRPCCWEGRASRRLYWPSLISLTTSPRSTRWATSRCARCAASSLDHRGGRVRGGHGRVGLGQVDADEHRRLPRSADGGTLPARRQRGLASSTRDELAEVRNHTLGFVFQSFNLLPRTSALENVELPLLYARRRDARAARSARARRSSASASATRLDHHPNQLSGGQQQRVAIARALVTEPQGASSPTSRPATSTRKTSVEVMALFQELGAAGITIVLVTHEPDIAEFAGARHRHARRTVRRIDARQSTTAHADARAAVAEEAARMNLSQTLRVALRALLRNKLRSFLTTLGIIIGVARSSRWWPSARAPRRRSRRPFAAMGSNLLIVMPGSHDRRRRARRLRLAADAHLGRSRGHPAARSPSVTLRGAGAALERAGHQRGAELDHPRHGHVARLLRHPQLAASRRARCFTRGRRGGREGRRARPDGRRQALRRERGSRRPDGAHQATCPSRSIGVLAKKGQSADRAGLRRRGLRARTRRSAARSRAACRTTSRARSYVGATSRTRPTRAERRSPTSCAIGTTCATAPTTTSTSAT